MSDYAVKNYGIFSNAVSTTTNVSNKVSEASTTITTAQTKLNDQSTFMGPAADESAKAATNCLSRLSNLTEAYSAISSYLVETSSTYKTGDEKAKVLTTDENGKVTVSTLSSAIISGKPVYYNQNGYYDQNGNWCQWESTWAKDIASSGCGPTSMASILATLYGDTSITPSTVANMLNYDDNVGGVYVQKAASVYNLDQTHNIGLDKETMNTFLRNNGKMIVAVNNGGHYISVLGINDNTNPPTYIVCDPNDSNTANKTWTYDDISNGHTMVFHIAPQGKTVKECLKPQTTSI